jgi:hypothetical protein
LEDLLKSVPNSRAREVTLVLNGHVNRVYTELMDKRSTKDACEEIAPMILKSVRHESVKKLECIRYSPHRGLLDCYVIRNCDLVYKALPLLQGLVELRAAIANRTEDMRLEVEG